MFFEGIEKKLEVIVSPEMPNLRALGKEFWEPVVLAAGAKILSELKTDQCTAYLLSESSLFVWDHRFTMITCGQTTLVKAVEKFLTSFKSNQVVSLIYERKNEYFPRWQKSDFFDDTRFLNNCFPGRAWQFGNSDEHHLLVYGFSQGFVAPPDDFTLEILMYDLQGPLRSLFSAGNCSTESLRQKTKVDQILPGFKVDDYVFDPCGYSLNALKNDDYFTIHVTPEEVGTYVSFETSVNKAEDIEPVAHRVLEVFRPQRFDLVLFSPMSMAQVPEWPEFRMKNHAQGSIDSGYSVNFCHYYSALDEPISPMVLEV
ncbi:MAG: hypothetical protein KDD22_02620 [Bdellovibrionales bacterium]|nr:hypothetical protein [Bdellovibrionales bacterium]